MEATRPAASELPDAPQHTLPRVPAPPPAAPAPTYGNLCSLLDTDAPASTPAPASPPTPAPHAYPSIDAPRADERAKRVYVQFQNVPKAPKAPRVPQVPQVPQVPRAAAAAPLAARRAAQLPPPPPPAHHRAAAAFFERHRRAVYAQQRARYDQLVRATHDAPVSESRVERLARHVRTRGVAACVARSFDDDDAQFADETRAARLRALPPPPAPPPAVTPHAAARALVAFVVRARLSAAYLRASGVTADVLVRCGMGADAFLRMPYTAREWHVELALTKAHLLGAMRLRGAHFAQLYSSTVHGWSEQCVRALFAFDADDVHAARAMSFAL